VPLDHRLALNVSGLDAFFITIVLVLWRSACATSFRTCLAGGTKRRLRCARLRSYEPCARAGRQPGGDRTRRLLDVDDHRGLGVGTKLTIYASEPPGATGGQAVTDVFDAEKLAFQQSSQKAASTRCTSCPCTAPS